MLVGFNPGVSSKQCKKQNPNFTALNIAQITKNEFEAENFVYDVAKGKIEKNAENIKDLKSAIQKAVTEGKVFISKILGEVDVDWAK